MKVLLNIYDPAEMKVRDMRLCFIVTQCPSISQSMQLSVISLLYYYKKNEKLTYTGVERSFTAMPPLLALNLEINLGILIKFSSWAQSWICSRTY